MVFRNEEPAAIKRQGRAGAGSARLLLIQDVALVSTHSKQEVAQQYLTEHFFRTLSMCRLIPSLNENCSERRMVLPWAIFRRVSFAFTM